MNIRTIFVVMLMVSIMAASACAEEYRITIPGAQGIYHWEPGTRYEPAHGDSVHCDYDFGHRFTSINSVSVHVTGTITPGVGVWEELPPPPPGAGGGDIPPPPPFSQGIVTSELSKISCGFLFDIWGYCRWDALERYTSVCSNGAFDAVSKFTTDAPPGTTYPPTDLFTELYSGYVTLRIFFYCSSDGRDLGDFMWQTLPVGQLDSVELIVDGTVPEPGSLAVLLCGLGGLGAVWRKRR